MGDMGEFWKDVRPAMQKSSRAKRAANRKNGESVLFLRRVPFLKKNAGAHLIVYPETPERRVDYWPGTGLWQSFWGNKSGRGMDSLLAFLEGK